QHVHLRAVDVVDQRLPAPLVEVHAADRDGDDLGAARLVRLLHHVERRVFPGPDEQARRELVFADAQRIGRHDGLYPPATATMISRRSPSCSGVSAWRARGTTPSFRATAVPSRCASSERKSASTVEPSGTSRASPFTLILTARCSRPVQQPPR